MIGHRVWPVAGGRHSRFLECVARDSPKGPSNWPGSDVGASDVHFSAAAWWARVAAGMHHNTLAVGSGCVCNYLCA